MLADSNIELRAELLELQRGEYIKSNKKSLIVDSFEAQTTRDNQKYEMRRSDMLGSTPVLK